MSEIKLDVVVETAGALASMEGLSASVNSSFESIGAGAVSAGQGAGALAEQLGAIPQLVETRFEAIDGVSAVVAQISSALDALPAEKVINVRSVYDMGAGLDGGSGLPGPSDNSYAVGTEMVPFDMRAVLHKGEAVLTPDQASAWRDMKNGGNGAGNGGSDPSIIIQNLTVVQSAGGAVKPINREFVRKQLAPELARYIRRSGRLGLSDSLGLAAG